MGLWVRERRKQAEGSPGAVVPGGGEKMIVVMKPGSTETHVDKVKEVLEDMELCGWLIESPDRKVVEVLGGDGHLNRERLQSAPMVDCVLTHSGPILAAARQAEDRTLEVPLGERSFIGGRKIAVIAGPCSVETRAQLLETAVAVKEAGATALRGGAFKPRTSPYSFQGHGERGLELLALVGEETGLPVVTEVMRCEHVELVARYADMLQVGSRNMHNTHLLAAVGRQHKPVLLKRGFCATLEELLLAAEYVMLEGNRNVVLCERGIRTFETHVRNTLALSIVPEIKRLSTLPVIVDPSHGTGRHDLVAPMSNAAIACGADGLIIEVHCSPREAWTDSFQALGPEEFRSLMSGLKPFARACDREL